MARGFAFGAVVVDQLGLAAGGGIDSSDLPDQVLYPSPAVNLCKPITGASP